MCGMPPAVRLMVAPRPLWASRTDAPALCRSLPAPAAGSAAAAPPSASVATTPASSPLPVMNGNVRESGDRRGRPRAPRSGSQTALDCPREAVVLRGPGGCGHVLRDGVGGGGTILGDVRIALGELLEQRHLGRVQPGLDRRGAGEPYAVGQDLAGEAGAVHGRGRPERKDDRRRSLERERV